jgi:hypothetical protein
MYIFDTPWGIAVAILKSCIYRISVFYRLKPKHIVFFFILKQKYVKLIDGKKTIWEQNGKFEAK